MCSAWLCKCEYDGSDTKIKKTTTTDNDDSENENGDCAVAAADAECWYLRRLQFVCVKKLFQTLHNANFFVCDAAAATAAT